MKTKIEEEWKRRQSVNNPVEWRHHAVQQRRRQLHRKWRRGVASEQQRRRNKNERRGVRNDRAEVRKGEGN